MKKFNFIEINYHHHREFNQPAQAIAKHRGPNLYASRLADHAKVTLVKHLEFEGRVTEGLVEIACFKGKNTFFHIPSKTHEYVKAQKPDIVLVQGFIFPWQVLALRRKLGPGPRIMLQHQGEQAFRRKKFFQKWMSAKVQGWLFASQANAEEWIEAGIIKDREKCFAIPPAAMLFAPKERSFARKQTGMNEGINFLWVGRLNKNKDPFTPVRAFQQFLHRGGKGKLYFIYGAADMENQLKLMIASDPLLNENVLLMGKLPHEELEDWYNAADFLISSSHREGGSFAIMEAMACGCVPIVSEIPASLQMIGQGSAGLHFPVGNAEALAELLMKTSTLDRNELSQKALAYFEREMSPEAVGGKMLEICEVLLAR